MISKLVYEYCCEDISKIENYDKAAADKTQTWQCHHRAEILPCGVYSTCDLITHDLYLQQPAERLIFLTRAEHLSLHHKGKIVAEETRRKMSEALKGKSLSDETRKKISEARKGKRLSEKTRKKISEANKGKRLSAETRRKISESNKGRHQSVETRRKISEARKCHLPTEEGKHL